MSQTTGLTVRHHQRRQIELPVEFIVSDGHRMQVRFTPASAAAGKYVVRGHTLDISPGGIGLRLAQFLPRMCEGRLRVFAPGAALETGDAANAQALFEHEVKVRRVTLLSADPTYMVGTAFVEPETDIDERIAAFLGRLDGLSEPAGGEGPDHA